MWSVKQWQDYIRRLNITTGSLGQEKKEEGYNYNLSFTLTQTTTLGPPLDAKYATRILYCLY